MPVAPHAAVIPGKFYHTGMFPWIVCPGHRHRVPCANWSQAYTEAINLLNYSVVAIPVTKADKSVDVVDTSYQPVDEYDRMNWDACESSSTDVM